MVYSELKEYIGQNGKISLNIAPGTTLGEIMRKLGLPVDRIMSVVCDQNVEDMDSVAKEGCVYRVLPLIDGG